MYKPSAPNWSVVPATAEELDVRGRMKQLVDEIERTTAALARMKVELFGLDEGLFALRAVRAPIHRVPNEILSHIFQDAADTRRPGDPINSTQYTCRRVCRRWNQVALGCDPIWIDFRIGRLWEVAAIEKCMERYGDWAPLAINLDRDWHQNPAFMTLAGEFLTRNITRLTSLSVTGGSLSKTTIILPKAIEKSEATITTLNYLDIDEGQDFVIHGNEIPQPFDLRRFGTLRYLSFSAKHTRILQGLSPSPILFPTNGPIEELKLHSMDFSFTQIQSILQGCPNLEHLHMLKVWVRMEEEPYPSFPKLVLHRLQRLRLYSPSLATSGLTPLFACLELPALSSIDLWCSDANPLSLVPLLRGLNNVRHARFFLSGKMFRRTMMTLYEDDSLLPQVRDFHLDAFPDGSTMPDLVNKRLWESREPLPDWFATVVKPITKSRWCLMKQLSSSVCLILPPAAPTALLEWLGRKGVRVEVVQRDPDAWPAGW